MSLDLLLDEVFNLGEAGEGSLVLTWQPGHEGGEAVVQLHRQEKPNTYLYALYLHRVSKLQLGYRVNRIWPQTLLKQLDKTILRTTSCGTHD